MLDHGHDSPDAGAQSDYLVFFVASGDHKAPDAAIALLDYHLDRLFTAENRPATSTKVSGGPPGPVSPA
jgi:hypothetical protein